MNKIGDVLTQWIKTGVQPAERDIVELAIALNSIQLNNIPATNWPSNGEIDFNDIPLSSVKFQRIMDRNLDMVNGECAITAEYVDIGIFHVEMAGDALLEIL
jgi:hypothetical protein